MYKKIFCAELPVVEISPDDTTVRETQVHFVSLCVQKH